MQVTRSPLASAPVWALVLFTGLVWGGGGLASKWLIDGGLDPFMMTAGPFLAAAGIAWVAAAAAGDTRRDAIAGGLFLGAINSALPALFFNIAYETLSAGLVTLLLSLGPVITAGMAHFAFADERFNRRKGVGLVLAVAGVAGLVAAPEVIEGTSYRGAAWTLAGALIAGATAVIARRLAMRHGARALLAPQLSAAGLTPVIAGLAIGRPLLPEGGLGATRLAVMLAIGVIASYGGFRSIMIANQRGTTGEVSMVSYLIPLVGVTGGIAFFGERLTPAIGVGAACILAGVALANAGSRAAAAAPVAPAAVPGGAAAQPRRPRRSRAPR